MGIRVVKTAAAAIAAIYTALYLELEPALAAGILAILGVEATRMKGLKSSVIRFVASVLGLFFASLIFTLFGFHYWVVAIFILFTFPILSRFMLKDGILTSCVIVFHLFAYKEVTVGIITNEVLLLLVGLGWATVINVLYMPKEDKGLASFKTQLESDFSEIFCEMALTLRNPGHVWSGSQLLHVEGVIAQGIEGSLRSRENRLWLHEGYWTSYFQMRREQFTSIGQMLSELALVYEKVPQGEHLADLLDQLAIDVKKDVYTGEAERKALELVKVFRGMELPKTREEFEIRAKLLTLLHEVDRYLAVARRLKKKPKQEAAANAREQEQGS